MSENETIKGNIACVYTLSVHYFIIVISNKLTSCHTSINRLRIVRNVFIQST